MRRKQCGVRSIGTWIPQQLSGGRAVLTLFLAGRRGGVRTASVKVPSGESRYFECRSHRPILVRRAEVRIDWEEHARRTGVWREPKTIVLDLGPDAMRPRYIQNGKEW